MNGIHLADAPKMIRVTQTAYQMRWPKANDNGYKYREKFEIGLFLLFSANRMATESITISDGANSRDCRPALTVDAHGIEKHFEAG